VPVFDSFSDHAMDYAASGEFCNYKSDCPMVLSLVPAFMRIPVATVVLMNKRTATGTAPCHRKILLSKEMMKIFGRSK